MDILAFLAASNPSTIFVTIRIILAVIIFVAMGFIIFVVMKQTSNSDGMEAMTGTSRSGDMESYYNRNPEARKEAVLKKWTYIAAIALAVCCIAFVVLEAIVPTAG